MTLDDEAIVKLKNVSLTYKTRIHGQSSLKGFFVNALKQRELSLTSQTPHLREITLEVRRGEQVGVIGRNGAGKSTLLKLISGILRPDSGVIHVSSGTTCLVDLESGMHPELTLEENIILSCSYFGWSPKETRRILKSILEWAELEKISSKPLNTLSTGMQSRLAFAVATSQTPDVLLVDEAISVGDIGFQDKAQTRLAKLRENGSASLIVTHDLAYIRKTTSRAIWIQDGTIFQDGPTSSVLESYEKSFHS